MYLTYEEYQNMGGTLNSTTFDEMAFEAETIINLYTYNRLLKDTTFSNNVKRCTYALIKLVQMKSSINPNSIGGDSSGSSSGGAAITSQSNDGVSISYNVLSASEIASTFKKDAKDIVSSYLAYELNSLGHRLLFKGLYPDE